MSPDMNETLDSVSTDERMDVDTSFLDAYRRGGKDGLKQAQTREAEPDTGETGETIEISEVLDDVQLDPDPKQDDDGTGQEQMREHEPEKNEDVRVERSGQHAGEGGSAAAATSAPASEVIPEPVPQEEDVDSGGEMTVATLDEETAASPMPPHAISEEITPGSLQLTDHQEAVQSAATGKGGSGGSADDAAVLPQSGLRLSGMKSQPHIKSLPESVISALREQQRSAAVRELGVSDQDAREFSERLSQGALVTAFLLAQLDLGIDADPATKRAAELFQSRDPLLGSMAARMDSLERLEADQGEQLGALRQELGEVRQTATVVEQAISYAIADRSENFLRGSHNIHDAPIGHKTAIFVRDRAREATQKQSRLEREREGRPIR